MPVQEELDTSIIISNAGEVIIYYYGSAFKHYDAYIPKNRVNTGIDQTPAEFQAVKKRN